MRPVWHRAMWSLQAAFAARRPQFGPPGDEDNVGLRQRRNRLPSTLVRSFAVSEYKGDWEFHVQMWELTTYWKTNRLCHVCDCSRRPRHGIPFSEFGYPWRRRSVAECVILCMPPAPNPMILTPGFHPGMMRHCGMHVLALGVYQTLVAEGILWLSEHCAFCNDPAEPMDKHLRAAFLDFKAWQRRESVTCSGRPFTTKRLHISDVDFPFLSYKAFNCRIALAWAAAADMQMVFRFVFLILSYILQIRFSVIFQYLNEASLCSDEIQAKICQRRPEEPDNLYTERLHLNKVVTSCVHFSCIISWVCLAS